MGNPTHPVAFVPAALGALPSNAQHMRPSNRRWVMAANPQAGNVAPVSRRKLLSTASAIITGAMLGNMAPPSESLAARPEGVNRPELLPEKFTTVIDLERFMASGEVRRLESKIDDLEKRTGYKIRVLTQRFPQTPGLAIRDYWQVDDNTVVMVADYFTGSGQLLKFNVGLNVDRVLPPRFWSLLASNYGNKFFVSKNGEAASIIGAVDAIRTCLLRDGCATPPEPNPSF